MKILLYGTADADFHVGNELPAASPVFAIYPAAHN